MDYIYGCLNSFKYFGFRCGFVYVFFQFLGAQCGCISPFINSKLLVR